MINYLRITKIIKNSKLITKKEKRNLLIKAYLEVIINSYKIIFFCPLYILKLFSFILMGIFESLSILFAIIDEILKNLIDKLPEVSLTKGQTRNKILKEITEKTIDKDDLK